MNNPTIQRGELLILLTLRIAAESTLFFLRKVEDVIVHRHVQS